MSILWRLVDTYLPPFEVLVADTVKALVLALWVLFVIHVLAKWSYYYAAKRWGHNVGVYIARKVIHMAAGGLVALLTPWVFHEPLVPSIAGVALAVYVYIPHKRGRLYTWFQDPENISEVYYSLAWAVAILIAWPINPLIAIYPLYLMSFGDGVTGIIRGIRQRRRVKSWDGSLGFFAVSAPIGYILFGWLGVFVALVSTLLEKWSRVDDNISIPLTSLAILLASHLIQYS